MKTKELLEAIQKVTPAVDGKSLVSQTDHFIFNQEVVSAYNGKIAISTPVDTDIECSVPGKDLLNIVKSIKDDDVELSVDSGVLHIISDDMRASISTEVEKESALIAISNFDLDDLLQGVAFELPDTFIEGLELCIPSASTQADDAKNLNCILVNEDRMYSGDGYRATLFSLDTEMERILFPVSSAAQLIKFNPTHFSITNGWFHCIDEYDTIFSLRVVDGDFPDIDSFISSFESSTSISLPDGVFEAAHDMGNIAESPVENFKVLEIEIIGEEIQCSVEKNGVYASKKIEFEGNDTDISFLISSTMLTSILKVTSDVEFNESFAMFKGENFRHLISLVQNNK